jgi:hypothetical protein
LIEFSNDKLINSFKEFYICFIAIDSHLLFRFQTLIKSIDDLDQKIADLQSSCTSKYQDKNCTVEAIDTMMSDIGTQDNDYGHRNGGKR